MIAEFLSSHKKGHPPKSYFAPSLSGVPQDSRYATNKEFFAETVKKLESEEGQKKISTVKELTKIAESLGTSMTCLALAWTIKNPNVSTCILGASKPEQIVENLKALDVIEKLTPEVMEKIEKVLENKPAGPVSDGGVFELRSGCGFRELTISPPYCFYIRMIR